MSDCEDKLANSLHAHASYRSSIDKHRIGDSIALVTPKYNRFVWHLLHRPNKKTNEINRWIWISADTVTSTKFIHQRKPFAIVQNFIVIAVVYLIKDTHNHFQMMYSNWNRFSLISLSYWTIKIDSFCWLITTHNAKHWK